jgi:hypothetical protein
VRAQYEGYRQTEGVAPNSQTPTFAAIRLLIDNWRWKGVPFYLRSGKSLANKTSQVIVVFQRPPHLMFHLPDEYQFVPNILSLCIQPDEGIHLMFEAKVPDSDQDMRSVDMEFHYRDSFTGVLPDAYETDPGSPARRCLALHPFRWDRGCLEADRFDHQQMGDEQRPRPGPLPAGKLGPIGGQRIAGT